MGEENHERANFLALQRDSHTNNIPPPTTPTPDEPLTPPSFDFLPNDFLATRRLDQASTSCSHSSLRQCQSLSKLFQSTELSAKIKKNLNHRSSVWKN